MESAIDRIIWEMVYGGMPKNMVILPNRCYHLASRVSHRAFFFGAEEKRQFDELMMRMVCGAWEAGRESTTDEHGRATLTLAHF